MGWEETRGNWEKPPAVRITEMEKVLRQFKPFFPGVYPNKEPSLEFLANNIKE
jgi:hypothetical protein